MSDLRGLILTTDKIDGLFLEVPKQFTADIFILATEQKSIGDHNFFHFGPLSQY